MSRLLGIRTLIRRLLAELYQPFLLSSHRLGIPHHFNSQQLITQSHNHAGQTGILAGGRPIARQSLPMQSPEHPP